MAISIASLNSGSNGNCYYIGNSEGAVLVDAGISCRETERRMKRLGLNMEHIRAIFVSHEHSDHITGIPALSKKYQIPVYITPETLRYSGIPIEQHLVHHFAAGDTITVGSLAVTCFAKQHDACDPHSFIITDNDVTIGVFTDIGACCQQVITHFNKCHAAFLEANYDDDMLDKGRYPYYLKNRIRGNNGHLSNAQALSLFLQHKSSNLSCLLLSHLSKDNNCPDLVQELFNRHTDNTAIHIASRYRESAVYHIHNATTVVSAPAEISVYEQLSLF